MPNLRIDNLDITAADGMTILQAAASVGIDIPHLCSADGCEAETSCLVCLVRVEGIRRLVPACATKVADGMIVLNNTDEVTLARRTALELLLAEHTGECFAPCRNVCPAHLDIPGMIQQINDGNLREAARIAREDLILPAILGHVCPGLCEKGCRRAAADQAVSICSLHRYAAEMDLATDNPWLPEIAPPTGKRVAIIGAGPAGLAAAYILLKRGHGVTLFDSAGAAGGTLRSSVDATKLPREVIDAEAALLARMGADFHFGQTLGQDITLDSLRQTHDAILIAVGQATPPSSSHPLPTSPKGEESKHDYPPESGDAPLSPPPWGRVREGVGMKGIPTLPPGVFAATAVHEHAVRAVADGKSAADAIDAFLAGRAVPTHRHPFAVRMGKLSAVEMQSFLADSSDHPRINLKDATFSPDQASTEAQRCMECGCHSIQWCRLRQYATQYQADPNRYRGERRAYVRNESHPSVTFERGKCIDCGLCVQVTRRHGEPLGLTFVGRGFDVHVAVPFGESLAEGLKQTADEACRVCPTGALRRRETE